MSQENSPLSFPLGFHFKVVFQKEIKSKVDSEFQSVSGLEVTVETEEYAEGGQNQYVHSLPKRTKYANLVLKRGLIMDQDLIKWIRNAVENLEFKPLNLDILLLDENGKALYKWNVFHAFPVKWSVSDFNAEESKIVIETLELKYQYFRSTK